MATTETDQEQLVGEFEVKGGDVLRVTRHLWGKYDSLELRRFTPDRFGPPGAMAPTRGGIRLQIAHWQRLLPILGGAVQTFLEGLEADPEGVQGAHE